MKQLYCINIMHISIILTLFLYIEVTEVMGQSVITRPADSEMYTDIHGESIEHAKSIKTYNNGCECIKYDCGCCQYIELDAVFINGTLCVNASYLEHDYGISITVTYNNFAIINETVSARNPPPICVGEDIVDAVELEICLHIYDIDVTSDKFHACFEVLGKVMKLKLSTIKLGCIDSKLKKKSIIEIISNDIY
ncbi:uncharacterized protein LOC114928437 [Nylanderia fulva]|uniref:uncharacterized protein LOC114928437 n=1 Tax=Nylanderia fulva TaxID=613905 RepID=UPI0010FB7855|nr:uncharacterized protein LOC114928437 [Nylanderia fulva]